MCMTPSGHGCAEQRVLSAEAKFQGLLQQRSFDTTDLEPYAEQLGFNVIELVQDAADIREVSI